MKYGLEKEFFLLKDGIIQMIPQLSGLPFDESGIQLEARGLPSEDIGLAVHNLLAEEYKIITKAGSLGYDTTDIPIMSVTRDFKRNVHRVYSKGILAFQNMYNYVDNRHSQNEITAGVHISFTNPVIKRVKISKDNYETVIVNGFFDFIKYVKILDKEFKEEIKVAKRNPGFYEVKDDLRVEYRSLPSNVNLYKVIDVINSIK